MRLLYVIIFVILSTFTYAQNASNNVYSFEELDVQHSKAQEFIKMGLYSSAIEILDDIISHTDNDHVKSIAISEMMLVQNFAGEHDKIIEYFQQITNNGILSKIEDYQTLASIYLAYATALESKEMFREAIAAREKEILYRIKAGKTVETARAYMSLSFDYSKLEQNWQAINYCDKSITTMMQSLDVTIDDIRKGYVKNETLGLAFGMKASYLMVAGNKAEANYNYALVIACGGNMSNNAKNILNVQGLNYKEILKNHP